MEKQFAIKGDASLDTITESIRTIETNDLKFVASRITGGRNILTFVFVDDRLRRSSVVGDGTPAPADSDLEWSGEMQVAGAPARVRLFRRKAAPALRAEAGPAAMRAGSGILPRERPRLGHDELIAKVQRFEIDRERYPLLVVGIRGYYTDSMGAPGVNDRGLYDDAIFVVSRQATVAFNGNTDPSSHRIGHGTGQAKGMASLMPGVWYAHRFGLHRGQYRALCQLAGHVTVLRDGRPPYVDSGMFGINIHRGGYGTTSSLGCQTLHPQQWPAFIALVEDQARRYHATAWNRTVIPYVLIAA